jgi:P pilus assembly chaperone PapD
MKLHPYFRMLPRVRLYMAKPMRAGCVARTSLLLAFILLGVVSLLHGQVDAVLRLSGRDAEMRVANPTQKPLRVTITLFKDSTLTDSVPARISPRAFTLKPGASQTVRLRLKARPQAGDHYRLATMFTPVAEEVQPRPTMHLTLATRIITRVEAGP